jgi:hypothetical protein
MAFMSISIFSNGGHLWYRTVLTETNLKGEHPRIISAKFGWDWLSSFREDFFLISIEISSNGQNCSILSQKVPKFELYKHNDELFNIYYGIFYGLWTFAYFDRLCKLEKRGDEIKKSSNLGTFWLKIEQFWPFDEISIFSNGGHLGYRKALTDTILKGEHILRDFLWTLNFCLFWPIMQIRKKGGWN